MHGLCYIAAITSSRLLISVLESWRAGRILCDAVLEMIPLTQFFKVILST